MPFAARTSSPAAVLHECCGNVAAARLPRTKNAVPMRAYAKPRKARRS